MAKLKNFLMRNKFLSIVVLVIIVLLAVFVFKNKNKVIESYTVATADVSQSVVLSGTLETSSKADLGFASSGRLNKISVKNNQNVKEGQILAQLEIDDLLADLRIKEANLKTTNLDLEDAKDELEKVTSQENAKVANAYRNLLTEDLELTPNSNSYTVTPPIISGIYNGAEGSYKINIKDENVNSDDLTLRTYNLEKTERIINEEGPTVLGSNGLYISFSDDLGDYDDTTWYLEIPNKSGSAYLANYNAYIEAKNDRDIKIKNAQVSLDKLLAEEGNSNNSIALAGIQKIRAEIKKNTIYAPFSGIVTNIEKEVGENASVGERVISILGEEQLQVVLQVSELDVSKILIGSEVKVTLDAFPGEEFLGILKNVNSRETTIEGVPVYEAFVELDADPRIKTGMSASGFIVLASKQDVLAIPSYYVEKIDGKNFVNILNLENKTEKREVTLGLLGSDSMIEILDGLNEGEKIVVSTK